jgi:hypothetical protein
MAAGRARPSLTSAGLLAGGTENNDSGMKGRRGGSPREAQRAKNRFDRRIEMAKSATEWNAAPRFPATHYVDSRIYTDDEIFKDEM